MTASFSTNISATEIFRGPEIKPSGTAPPRPVGLHTARLAGCDGCLDSEVGVIRLGASSSSFAAPTPKPITGPNSQCRKKGGGYILIEFEISSSTVSTAFRQPPIDSCAGFVMLAQTGLAKSSLRILETKSMYDYLYHSFSTAHRFDVANPVRASMALRPTRPAWSLPAGSCQR